MTSTFLNLPAQVTADEYGGLTAPIDLLVPNPDNPRSTKNFDPDLDQDFQKLVDSIDINGVLDAIRCFVGDDVKLQQQNGHRRMAAVRRINADRRRFYEEAVKRGDSNATPPSFIDRVPVAIVRRFPNEFERKVDMWNEEVTKKKWDFPTLVPFYKKTFDEAPESVRDDPKAMAAHLSLPTSRVKLLNTIVNSPALLLAATSPDILPERGREKTLRSIARCADVIFDERPEVARRIAGRTQLDTVTLEAVRDAMVLKAAEYSTVGLPPGVALERTAPLLRNADELDDDTVVDWARDVGVLAEDKMPTTVKSGGRRSRNWVDTLRAEVNTDPSTLSPADISLRVEELVAAGELIDAALAKAKSALRRTSAA